MMKKKKALMILGILAVPLMVRVNVSLAAAERGTPQEAKTMLHKAGEHYKSVGRTQALADFNSQTRLQYTVSRREVLMVMEFFLGNYKTVGARLGLTVENGRIYGTVDGIPLQIWFGPHATHIGAFLPTTATMEFSIVTKSLIGK